MIKLEPNRYYHIYNRGYNLEKLFYKKPITSTFCQNFSSIVFMCLQPMLFA